MARSRALLGFFKTYSMLPIAVVLFVLSTAINGDFVSGFNISAILIDMAIFGFLVLGEALVVLTGGIDLSVGNMASMSSVIIAWTMRGLVPVMPGGAAMVLSMLAGLALCGIIGLGSGFVVARLSITPLIATLGSMWLVQGIGYWFLKGVPTPYPVPAFKEIFAGTAGFLPYSILFLLAASVLIAFVLKRWRFGRWIYAVGGNEYASSISGVPVYRVKLVVYTASAVLAGFGGVLVGAFASVGYPRACNGYELYAIAAIVMGGISLTGGEGNLWNALAGMLVLRILNKLMIFSGLSGYLEGMFVGAILVIMLVIGSLRGPGARAARTRRAA
jgi:ribose/xylose/arabinose/galactoside ABC-type transport system permease subunit